MSLYLDTNQRSPAAEPVQGASSHEHSGDEYERYSRLQRNLWLQLNLTSYRIHEKKYYRYCVG